MSEDKQKPFWQDAAIAFGRITGWIAAPIIAAVIIGGKLDEKHGTNTRWLLICAGIALAVSIIGVAFETKRYMRQVKWNEEKNKNGN